MGINVGEPSIGETSMGIKVELAEAGVLKGNYVVMDPCYVIQGKDDNAWQEMVALMYGEGSSIENNWFLVDGQLVYIWGTEMGDGSYPVYAHGDWEGEACVDSGTLAFVPLSLVKKLVPRQAEAIRMGIDTLGVLVVLDKAEPNLSGGDVKVGEVEVFTGPDDPYAEAEEERDRIERETMDDVKSELGGMGE